MTDARRIWDTIRSAIALPALPADSDVDLTLLLGQRALGWIVRGERGERPGPALDLTGASVVLQVVPMPEKHDEVTRLRLMHAEPADLRRAGLIWRGSSLYQITGTVDDEAAGQVTFALPRAKLATPGRFLGRPLVTAADERQFTPRLVKFGVYGGEF